MLEFVFLAPLFLAFFLALHYEYKKKGGDEMKRFFVVMEVQKKEHNNGYIPVETPQGDIWIAEARVFPLDEVEGEGKIKKIEELIKELKGSL